MTKRISLLTVSILSASALTACGGGGDNESSQPVAENQIPEAVISSVPEIEERSSYTISGTNSSDADGSVAQYSWLLDADDNRMTLEDLGNGEAKLTINELIEDVNSTITLKVTDDEGAEASSEVTFVAKEIDRENLPPRPDIEEGKATVNGIDDNENGIRDDVEWAIYNLYEESYTNREIAKTGGYALQKAMEAAQTDVDTDNDAVSRMLAEFVFCLNEFAEVDRQSALAALQTFQVNTSERTEVYLNYNLSRHGTIQKIEPVDNKSECLFSEREGNNNE
jgi:hypothetical protein